jgi:ferric-dicitrate binding protein FerR (iron transport regulator)
MAEDWQLKQLERRFDSLEKRLERDQELAREEKEQARNEKRRRAERINCWLYEIAWAACVATVVTYILWG